MQGNVQKKVELKMTVTLSNIKILYTTYVIDGSLNSDSFPVCVVDCIFRF